MYFNSEAYDKLYPKRRRDELVSAAKPEVESVIETFESKDGEIKSEVKEEVSSGDGRVCDPSSE